jgi:predicted acylesterase/phospholipase RssA
MIKTLSLLAIPCFTTLGTANTDYNSPE